ncbi:hypothetical protein NPS01_37750 [Nocardioides psychrotolerans]|uniref:Phage protein, HK97 gp10 family n=1 Tax=Nocardioides psychrotolerans TaxID=1005945 RepID=A0A1I3I6P1_9ACTN|nr:HK97-gp10 family putative phage morphogenesis protein [Nocardioides psychrotolerans]GEP40112.1 hypothetical protein NPS01_37750 [Nocardioides psychrotolerans]SFI43596.1 phage protein, HK97 gp10 family [Nocardioides psychrotolerans]
MGISIDTSELRELAVTLRASSGRVGAQAASALRRTAYAIEADAKALAPVDTGNLRSSIDTDIVGDGRHGAMTAEIGPSADYAPYVEFGTSVSAGQAFMGPAFERQVPGFEKAIEQIVDNIL